MTVVTRSADAGMDLSTGVFANQISGLIAGEDLAVCAVCRIDATDGLVYESDGTAVDSDAFVDGFTPRAVKAGQAVALFGNGARFHYAESGMTPGERLYLAATPGLLDDAASTGDTVGVAKAINATDIRIVRDE